MSGYTSNRVYSGVRLLKAEQALAHRRRAVAAMERQQPGARWEVSDETREAERAIDQNIALAAIRANTIILD